VNVNTSGAVFVGHSGFSYLGQSPPRFRHLYKQRLVSYVRGRLRECKALGGILPVLLTHAHTSSGTGTSAVAFASEVPDFGPTQNLWLTHDGYLFEVTTYPNLGPWLTPIIATIRFP
jgi:hypothetical protein